MGERSGRFDVGALATAFSHPVVVEGLPALSNTFTVDALLERTPERRYRGRGGGYGAARGSVRGAAASRGRPRRVGAAPAVPLAPPAAEAGGAAGGAAIQPGSPLSEEEQEQEAQQEVHMDLDLPEEDAGAGLLYAVPGAPPGHHEQKEGDPLVLAFRRPTPFSFSFLVGRSAPLSWRRSSEIQWHEVVSQVDAGGHPEEGARLDDPVGAEDPVHHDFGVCRSCFPTQLPGYISAIASDGFGKPSDPFPPRLPSPLPLLLPPLSPRPASCCLFPSQITKIINNDFSWVVTHLAQRPTANTLLRPLALCTASAASSQCGAACSSLPTFLRQTPSFGGALSNCPLRCWVCARTPFSRL